MNYKIIKLDNGKYWTRLSLTAKDGTRYQPSKTARTQGELKRWAMDEIRKNEEGLTGRKRTIRVADVVTEYMAKQANLLKDMTLHIRHYELQRLVQHFGTRDINKLTRKELIEWTDQMALMRGIKTSSRNAGARHINALLKYAREQEYVHDRELRIPMRREYKEREKTLWTIDHIKQFEERYKDTPEAKLYLTLIHTGMRSNEARSLGWEQVDFKNNLIHVERQAHQPYKAGIKTWATVKTGESRIIPMSNRLRKILERWRFEQRTWLHEHGAQNEQDLVFTLTNGQYIYDAFATRTFKRLLEETDLPSITSHTLRHTYATLLIQEGLPLTGVQAMLGHANLSTTVQTYLHVTDEMKDRTRTLLDAMYDDKNA
ncbi:site-specific integrase [Exiguobacterium sp.]|uniref:tyrosine-type recombinase/integrase n=1 Tax=Exiguobacterium sp. TaxID=44751 RepID=UPI00289CD315|nr:site-specific integrase [Exiguobacterium sp.]